MGSGAVRSDLRTLISSSEVWFSILSRAGAALLILYCVWLLSQRGIPTISTFVDHTAHMYKAYLASIGEVRAVHWNDENVFLVGPVPYSVLWGFTRFLSFDVAYRVAYVLILLMLVLLSYNYPEFTVPFVTVYGIGSVIVGRFPGLLAYLFGALALILFRSRRYLLSAVMGSLAVLSEPADAILYVLFLAGLAVDELRKDRRSLFALFPAVLLGVYGIVLMLAFPHSASVVRATLFSGVTAQSTLRLVLVLANTIPILLFAGTFSVLLWKRLRIASLVLLGLVAYFLAGWAFLPASFPLAKVWPLSYVIFFTFGYFLYLRPFCVSRCSFET